VLFFLQLPLFIVAKIPGWKTDHWQLSAVCQILRYYPQQLKAIFSINSQSALTPLEKDPLKTDNKS
jgi:hypothetical protein